MIHPNKVRSACIARFQPINAILDIRYHRQNSRPLYYLANRDLTSGGSAQPR